MNEPNLELLQTMIQRVLDGQREQRQDVLELKQGLTNLRVEVVHLHGDFADQSVRMDRFDQRLERIERRMDLADA